MPTASNRQQGFTIVELLLAILIVSIIAGIFLLNALPNKLGETKKRQDDISIIGTALRKYVTENNGVHPETISAKPKEICKINTPDCRGLVDLSFLTLGEKYLKTIPVDPIGGSKSGTGYFIYSLDGKTFTIVAHDIERNQLFEVKK